MSEKFKCYWTKDSYCGLEIDQSDYEVFIIGSCDSSRRKYIDAIIDVVEREFKMKAIFAEDLSQHNGYKAFCSNICSPIIKSTLVIVDLSAPNKDITCSKCNQGIETLQQSVNVYWEYGYACGLAKRILLLIDESQINNMPFDVADTQIEVYNMNNLRNTLKKLMEIKLKEPLPPKRYHFIPSILPTTPIGGTGDHRVQPLIDLIKYKVGDYYREITPEKKIIIRKLINILGTFNPIFLKYTKSGGLVLLISDYFGISLKDFQSQLEKDKIHIKMPRRSNFIIAGDFAFKIQKYKNIHPGLEDILIGDVHGEFDTEIQMHEIFPQSMNIINEFLPALRELRNLGFIKGEQYKDQSSNTKFLSRSEMDLKRFIEIYSLDYYFQQYFNL